MTSLYYDLGKFVASIIDVSVDCSFQDGELDIELHVKIPIATEIEQAYVKLTSPS